MSIPPFGIHHGDCIEGMKSLPDSCAQIVLCDPPYNIGKDFGNDSDKQDLDEYIEWCKEWLIEAVRIMKPEGTLYIYGFSEILSHIQVRCLPNTPKLGVRWLIWHYTNKNVPSLKFWQRSHEAILCIWKKDGRGYPTFHMDEVREPYTDTFLKNAAGKTRKPTAGRFSDGSTSTTYVAHEKGALPRDVIKVAALAGGAGKKERVKHPTQKPLEICNRLIKAAASRGDLMIIPFGGSGSECVAAKNLGVHFIAYEINEEYVGLINERLKQTETETEIETQTENNQ